MSVKPQNVSRYAINCVVSKNRAPIFVFDISPMFPLTRIFWINGDAGEVRGKHAHHKCRQLLICVVGSIFVKLVTKCGQTNFISISSHDNALLIEPLTWLEIEFQSAGTLMVACDRKYEHEDYIYSLEELRS